MVCSTHLFRFENKVKATLDETIRQKNLEDVFDQVVVPTEQVVELVKGERKTTTRKFYPGYIMVRMILNDETWHVVRSTPKVTGFLGSQEKPAPLLMKRRTDNQPDGRGSGEAEAQILL